MCSSYRNLLRMNVKRRRPGGQRRRKSMRLLRDKVLRALIFTKPEIPAPFAPEVDSGSTSIPLR